MQHRRTCIAFALDAGLGLLGRGGLGLDCLLGCIHKRGFQFVFQHQTRQINCSPPAPRGSIFLPLPLPEASALASPSRPYR